MRVFELFSGIGGMHFAFKESGVEFEIIRALDINTTANAVYRHNFPKTRLLQKNIESLTERHFNELDIEMISMSPPCQPYTRQGLQKGESDSRSAALTHMLALIPRLTTLKYIIIENVVGFEKSTTRKQVTSVLDSSGFRYQEFILCPTQLHIPNSRNRYYLLAKKVEDRFDFEEKKTIHHELPDLKNESIAQLVHKFKHQCFTIAKILDDSPGPLLEDKVLKNYSLILDIVTRESERTCCFTKGYSRYAEGTGSVFCPFDVQTIHQVYRNVESMNINDDGYLGAMKTLQMRYFSPNEVARLMAFPEYFSFPGDISLKQKYRLLGNSINVHVVAVLIKILLL